MCKKLRSSRRAIVSDPKILLLDEPTAALDAHTESAVLLALEKASMNRTTICVTHKPHQARKADYVLVFTPAGIVERGTPETLLEAGGLFSSFMASSDSMPQAEDKENSQGNLKTEIVAEDLGAEKGQLDIEKQQNKAAQASNYSLLKCITVIMWGHRQHWPWMLALLIPCLLGGEPVHLLYLPLLLLTSSLANRRHLPRRSYLIRRDGICFWKTTIRGARRNAVLGVPIPRHVVHHPRRVRTHRTQRNHIELREKPKPLRFVA
jgi:hypothetical protein